MRQVYTTSTSTGEDSQSHTRYLKAQFYMRTYSCAELFELFASVPALEMVSCHNFDYDATRQSDPRNDPSQLAVMAVLQKRAG